MRDFDQSESTQAFFLAAFFFVAFFFAAFLATFLAICLLPGQRPEMGSGLWPATNTSLCCLRNTRMRRGDTCRSIGRRSRET